MLIEELSRDLFDQPIMSNVARAFYVERLIASLLGNDWSYCGYDWGGWDIEHKTSGIKCEVKQGAAIQSWNARNAIDDSPQLSLPRFDIACRTGFYEDGVTWRKANGRIADFYVFAWHPINSLSTADHRDETQWVFYLCCSSKLPNQKTIGLKPLVEIADRQDSTGLSKAVDGLVDRMASSWANSKEVPSGNEGGSQP